MDAPQLCIGLVRHRRLRPADHEFAYRVYQLRLPLRRLAQSAWTHPLVGINRRRLLSFFERDHGDGCGDALGWIDALLEGAGITDATGEIWLQTFPRIFGYLFNPVSFWFCQRGDGALRAIVCEVNNTFGERHCYLLAHADGSPLRDGELLTAQKVFHVSPFCDVSGHYRFRFLDAHRADGDRFVARIDLDDEHGPLLQTSIGGHLQPVTTAAVLRTFIGAPLLTFGVIVRIHWQALQLWRKRVPFFRKPLPPAAGVSQ